MASKTTIIAARSSVGPFPSSFAKTNQNYFTQLQENLENDIEIGGERPSDEEDEQGGIAQVSYCIIN